MKIVNIIGGLGNQMFQYAFALALKKANADERVYIDTSHYNYLFIKKYKTSNLHNGFELYRLFPNVCIPRASAWNLIRLTYYVPNYMLSRMVRKIMPRRKSEYVAPIDESQTFRHELINYKGDMYYEGYWQAASYFANCKEEVMEAFAHPQPNPYNKELIKEISESQSVGIHIRRGNYLLLQRYSGICEIDYYRKAIERIMEIRKEYHFFIFSNDMKWCDENIVPLLNGMNVTLVTGNAGTDSCWDMFLMTYCHDLIIANSSFSWWGAFLNKSVNRVIAPYPWMNGRDINDVYDKQWIKISGM